MSLIIVFVENNSIRGNEIALLIFLSIYGDDTVAWLLPSFSRISRSISFFFLLLCVCVCNISIIIKSIKNVQIHLDLLTPDVDFGFQYRFQQIFKLYLIWFPFNYLLIENIATTYIFLPCGTYLYIQNRSACSTYPIITKR